MLSVAEAQAHVLAAGSTRRRETVSLSKAHGRYLAEDVTALLTQPPFHASAMDGYAVRFEDIAPGLTFPVIGEAIAGKAFDGVFEDGVAVRVLTGAPMPEGSDTVILQEDVAYEDGAIRLIGDFPLQAGRHVRKAGQDFTAGAVLLQAGTRLNARSIALMASSGHGAAEVYVPPRVAILSTGDELVPPGQMPGPSQIINSNGVMLASMLRACGAEVQDYGILPDRHDVIRDAIIKAALDADILVTIGGASVGDHDYVQAALVDAGAYIDFWKIAMRPGKPMMLGTMGESVVLGLPGNPVSAYVCAQLFLLPLVRHLMGAADPLPRPLQGRLTVDLRANGGRVDYMRAIVRAGEDGWEVTPFPVQDSAMLSRLEAANALAIRPIHAPAAEKGSNIAFLPLNTD